MLLLAAGTAGVSVGSGVATTAVVTGCTGATGVSVNWAVVPFAIGMFGCMTI